MFLKSLIQLKNKDMFHHNSWIEKQIILSLLPAKSNEEQTSNTYKHFRIEKEKTNKTKWKTKIY